MTREEVEALVNRRKAAFDQHDAAALTAMHAPDSVVESLMAGKVTGHAAIEEVYHTWFGAFPDVASTPDTVLIDGDRVVVITQYTGTDMGGFMGVPPTGKPFKLPMVHLLTLRDGLIVHERRIYDFTGLLVQVGVLKAKPA